MTTNKSFIMPDLPVAKIGFGSVEWVLKNSVKPSY